MNRNRSNPCEGEEVDYHLGSSQGLKEEICDPVSYERGLEKKLGPANP